MVVAAGERKVGISTGLPVQLAEVEAPARPERAAAGWLGGWQGPDATRTWPRRRSVGSPFETASSLARGL